jgi:hypothetical protein
MAKTQDVENRGWSMSNPFYAAVFFLFAASSAFAADLPQRADANLSSPSALGVEIIEGCILNC